MYCTTRCTAGAGAITYSMSSQLTTWGWIVCVQGLAAAGQAVRVKASVGGSSVERTYTPISDRDQVWIGEACRARKHPRTESILIYHQLAVLLCTYTGRVL